MTIPDYTLLNHTADLAVRIRGTDLTDLFENSGRTLMHLMFGRELPCEGSALEISLKAQDLDDLMVRWLSEILYLLEGEHLVVTAVEIKAVTPLRLHASVRTIPFDPEIHEILSEIKAITYHQIEVAQKVGHWEARVIMDV